MKEIKIILDEKKVQKDIKNYNVISKQLLLLGYN